MASPRCILLICVFACVLSSTLSWPHHHPDHDESENELDAKFDVDDEEFPDDEELLGVDPKSMLLEDEELGDEKNDEELDRKQEDEKVEPEDEEEDLEIEPEDIDVLNKDGVNDEDGDYKGVRDDEEMSVEDAKEIHQWLKELADEKHDTSDEEVFGKEFEEWVRKIIGKVKDEERHTTEAEWGIF